MGKEDLIVDNPLLLTSLFPKGVFAIPTDANTTAATGTKSGKLGTTLDSHATDNASTIEDNPAEVPVEAALQTNETTPVNSNIQNTEVVAPTNLGRATEEHKHIPKTTVTIPNVSVLHLVVETGNSPYREETIPNAMNALGKLLTNKQTPSFEIIDVTTLEVALKEYIAAIPPNVNLVFWGKDSHLLQEVDLSNKHCLLLDMPSVMLASQENKIQHWNQIKAFFKVM